MNAELLQFAASLAAVAALVGVVHLAGFSRPKPMTDEREARELASLAPGGFHPARIAIDQDGKGAIAADAAGRMVLLRAHGSHFVAEPVAGDSLRADGDTLLIEAKGRAIALRLGSEAAKWTAASSSA